MQVLGSSAAWRFMLRYIFVLRYIEFVVFPIVGLVVRNPKNKFKTPLLNLGHVQHILIGATF